MNWKGVAVGAPFVLALAGWITWQEAFPEHFIQTFGIDGKLELTHLTRDGRLVLIEDVSRRSAKGPSYRAARLRILDAKTGSTVGGPWGLPKQRWLGFGAGLVLSENSKTGLEGRSLATGEVVLDMAKLEALAPEIAGHLKPESAQFAFDQGRLTFRTDQGRAFSVDPAGPSLSEARKDAAPRSASPAPQWRSAGGDRKSITDTEPTFLLPEWLDDGTTQAPFSGGGVWLAKHFERLGPSGGEGLTVSAIRVGGDEAWRHTPALPGVREVFSGGDDLALVVESHGGDWGIEALELATGKVRWAMSGAL